MGMYSLLVGKIHFKPGAAALVENLLSQGEDDSLDIDWKAAIAVCPLAKTSEAAVRFAQNPASKNFIWLGGGEGYVNEHREWPEDGPYLRWDVATGELDMAVTVRDGRGIEAFTSILPDLADEWHLVDRFEDYNSRQRYHDFPAVERPEPEQEESHGYGF